MPEIPPNIDVNEFRQVAQDPSVRRENVWSEIAGQLPPTQDPFFELVRMRLERDQKVIPTEEMRGLARGFDRVRKQALENEFRSRDIDFRVLIELYLQRTGVLEPRKVPTQTSQSGRTGRGVSRRRLLGIGATMVVGAAAERAFQALGPVFASPAQASPRSLVGVPAGGEAAEVLPTPDIPKIVKHSEAEVGFVEGVITEAAMVEPTRKDILREMFLPRIVKEVRQIREQRVKEDMDYLKRIDRELNEGRINGVLLGIGKEGTMTDSILIFSYHLPTNTAFLLSVPRDLESPEVLRVGKNSAWSRINFAYQLGGIDLVKEVLENATGLSMDLATVSRFDVLEDVIDKTVRYVEVDVKEAISDPRYPTKEGAGFDPFYLKQGRQQLNGPTALKYVRSRLHQGGSDYVRAGRQQEVLAAFFQRLVEEVQKSPFNKGHLALNLRNVLLEKINQGRLKPDFDLEGLFSPALLEIVKMTGEGILQQFSGGWELGAPEMKGLVISNRNFVTGAGIEGVAITMVRGGNPTSSNPREAYWKPIRQEVRKQLLLLTQGKQGEEVPTLPESKIYYPQELSYGEVARWIGMLRNSHDAVLTESLFLKELAQFPKEKREKILAGLAKAHAKAIVEHYGQGHAVIGLDPGHGASDIGVAATTVEGEKLAEKDMTWELANLTARELLRASEGSYDLVILRPEIPQDEDVDGDGLVSNIERIQKRKALLLAMAEALRTPDEGEDRKVAYVSLHFNGLTDGNAVGAETSFPNEYAMPDGKRRASSEALARSLQQEIVKALKEAGYDVFDRGARPDPDKREPGKNSDNVGPYTALGSPKLDRNLARKEGR